MGRDGSDVESNLRNMMMYGTDNMAVDNEDTLTASAGLDGNEIYLTEEDR